MEPIECLPWPHDLLYRRNRPWEKEGANIIQFRVIFRPLNLRKCTSYLEAKLPNPISFPSIWSNCSRFFVQDEAYNSLMESTPTLTAVSSCPGTHRSDTFISGSHVFTVIFLIAYSLFCGYSAPCSLTLDHRWLQSIQLLLETQH